MAHQPPIAHPRVSTGNHRGIGEEVPARATAGHLSAEFRVVSQREAHHARSVAVVSDEGVSFGYRQLGIEAQREFAKCIASRSALLELCLDGVLSGFSLDFGDPPSG